LEVKLPVFNFAGCLPFFSFEPSCVPDKKSKEESGGAALPSAENQSCNGNVWFVVVLSIAVPLCHCNQLIASSRNLLVGAFSVLSSFALARSSTEQGCHINLLNGRFYQIEFNRDLFSDSPEIEFGVC
jgi:hypothetical protein